MCCGVGGRAALLSLAIGGGPLGLLLRLSGSGCRSARRVIDGQRRSTLRPRTLSTLVEQRAALVLRAFTAPSDVFRTS